MAGVDSRKGQEIFLYSTLSRPTQGPTQPPSQWVPGALSPGVKGLGHEADHSPLSSADVKNSGGITPLRHTSSWLGDYTIDSKSSVYSIRKCVFMQIVWRPKGEKLGGRKLSITG
jgi:hypothetical protein